MSARVVATRGALFGGSNDVVVRDLLYLMYENVYRVSGNGLSRIAGCVYAAQSHNVVKNFYSIFFLDEWCFK